MPLPAPLQHPLLAYLTTTLKLLTLYHLLTTTYPRIPTSSPTTGPSMLPTIHTAGDRVLVSRKYRRGKGIKVGDLVDFKSPLEEGVACVKRVVGMPGDIVARCAGGAQFAGGRERKGDLGEGEDGEGKGDGMTMLCQVPRGHVWLEGDNLTESRDSRMYGPVPMGLIRGKVVARWWPWGEEWRLEGAGFAIRKGVEGRKT